MASYIGGGGLLPIHKNMQLEIFSCIYFLTQLIPSTCCSTCGTCFLIMIADARGVKQMTKFPLFRIGKCFMDYITGKRIDQIEICPLTPTFMVAYPVCAYMNSVVHGI